ncbi:hypothetical protein PC129_g5433 [Phytophthora cactorum]|uniref:Tc1-like transposase DDE domain-containing protein n=1 Tax=Phytophthora cactorum TaxID=29920 RepID=A0A8T1IGF6_9STRA|nr:hypothetical protein PC113_g7656 [Phytophthora cactorum]KAG2922004.1 hypothetical protein PC114_g5436 [Phytophthora cactorum]KAG2946505.1 hypothetical protein PC117_g7559 [Phytophthora cactorum]KAG3202325.1 hypothetical protein PC128_g3255 [Phytophthora cactorum]KAG3223910.1 hypothetical protein PC129_g5433 [Phytophthora cactorum]
MGRERPSPTRSTASRRAIKAGRGPQSDDRKAGRRPVLSDREVRQVVRAAATGDYFAADLKTKFSVTASVRTIQRLLKNVDHLVYTKMDRTLPLTAAHKSARMAWAQEHILNPGIWESTNFSDEKKFNLDGPEGYKFYSHDLRQPTQSYVRRQNGGGSVMVCGAFSDKGKSKLAILRDRQNSDYVFQQVNASIHASRETKHFLQEMQVSTMVWPARSPDCNPIENVWSAMASRVYAHGRQYDNVDQLEAAIFAAWDSIEQEYLLQLLESNSRRRLAVIKEKGALTSHKKVRFGRKRGWF